MMRCSLVVLVFVGLSGVTLAAQKGNKQEELREQQAEQKATQGLRAARDKWEAAKKSLAAAIKASQQAEAARDAAAQRSQEVKARASGKQLSKSGLNEARERQVTAKQEFAAALANLKESADYKLAVETATSARREYGTGDTSPMNLQRLKELIERPAQLERAVIAANPLAKTLQDKLTQADESVAAAQKKLAQLIETDPELKEASQTFDKAEELFQTAQRKLAVEQRNTATAAQKVSQENAQLNNIKKKDKQPNQKNKGKK